MRTIKKNVYYCDFCKKRNLSASHMHKHEKGCTNNPNRICGICKRQPDSLKETIKKFKDRFSIKDDVCYPGNYTIEKIVWYEDKPVTLDEIRETVDCCPACMLAILRQTHMTWQLFDFNFDFQKERARWWCDEDRKLKEEEY
jgi:hypothetical protein